MSSDYVLIFDSGSGGEYVLNICHSILPNEKFIFYKDVNNCPYGNKSYKKLKSIFFDSLKALAIRYHFKAVVIACNTMSSMFGRTLKRSKLFKKVFLVTPPLNSSILSQKTLLLATTNTCKYNNLIDKYKNDDKLYLLSLPSLAVDIDNARSSGDFCSITKRVKRLVSPFVNSGIKNVVLGCTHYNYISPQIENTLGPVHIFENSPKIILKLKKYLENNNLLADKGDVIVLEKI